MRRKVYSYVRFSTPEQAKGHSLERQMTYASEYAKEHNLILDESLTMRDEGLSAYHQRHIQKGALGTFCKAIDDGLVAPGSVLIVENLDRLNRGKVRLAMPFLLNIVNSGITVITASDGREYSQATLDENNYQLFESLSIMSRAHEESETKSKRVKASIVGQIKHWLEHGHGKIIRNGADPYWCKPKEDKSGFDLQPERVEIIKCIIRLYMSGWGYNKIVGYLNNHYAPFKGKRWYVQYITTFIKNRTLLGERSFSVNNETFVIKNYYPAILSDMEFNELQQIIKQRASTKAQQKVPSIVTGMKIAYCGLCGEVLCSQNFSFRAKDGVLSDGLRRIRCNAKNNGQKCVNSKSTSIVPIERALLEYCADQMELTSILGDNDQTIDLRVQIVDQHRSLAETEQKLQAGEQSILDLLSQGHTVSPVINNLVEQLRDEKEQQQQRIHDLEEELRYHSRHKATDLAEEWQKLKLDVYDLNEETRLMVRQLVKRTFKRLDIFLHGVEASKLPRSIKDCFSTGEDHIDIILTFPNDRTRLLSIDRKTGSWIKGGDLDKQKITGATLQALAARQTSEIPEPA